VVRGDIVFLRGFQPQQFVNALLGVQDVADAGAIAGHDGFVEPQGFDPVLLAGSSGVLQEDFPRASKIILAGPEFDVVAFFEDALDVALV